MSITTLIPRFLRPRAERAQSSALVVREAAMVAREFPTLSAHALTRLPDPPPAPPSEYERTLAERGYIELRGEVTGKKRQPGTESFTLDVADPTMNGLAGASGGGTTATFTLARPLAPYIRDDARVRVVIIVEA